MVPDLAEASRLNQPGPGAIRSRPEMARGSILLGAAAGNLDDPEERAHRPDEESDHEPLHGSSVGVLG